MISHETERQTQKSIHVSESGSPMFDLASLLASVEKINHRLDRLEKEAGCPRSEIQGLKYQHPSQDKFDIAEAIADEIFAGIPKEKACAFEPNGKPCDHCSMCNSRGF